MLFTPSGNPAFVHSTIRNESGSFTGNGFRMAASTRLKIAALVPTPMLSESTTASTSAGDLRNWRIAYRTSRSTDSGHSMIPTALVSSPIRVTLPSLHPPFPLRRTSYHVCRI